MRIGDCCFVFRLMVGLVQYFVFDVESMGIMGKFGWFFVFYFQDFILFLKILIFFINLLWFRIL